MFTHSPFKKKKKVRNLISKPPSNTSTERTIGIDQSSATIGGGEVSIWDFGGQIEYSVTHGFFLSSQVFMKTIHHKIIFYIQYYYFYHFIDS
jgi:GTPase SAR1 family protein